VIGNFRKSVGRYLWKLLASRSAAHRFWSPTRKNTLGSIALILTAIPFVALAFPIAALLFILGKRVQVYELRVDGEFAWLVDHLERVRERASRNRFPVVVLVRSSFRHKGLAHLYRFGSGCFILWSRGTSVLLAQILLLLPKRIIRREHIYNNNYFLLNMSTIPMVPTRKLVRVRNRTLENLGCSQSRYVTMAIFTSTDAEKNDCHYSIKYQPRETIGSELVEPVLFLRNLEIDVIMLGFPDSGKAHIPIRVPRLSEFGNLGGLHEVALASGCLYFWSDFVGAQWLREPFKKRVLITNHDEIFVPKRFNFPPEVLENYRIVPLRFQSPAGNLLTFREALNRSPCFSQFGTGKLFAIRNSPTDIICAHQEMLTLVNGEFIESDEIGELYERLERLYSDFPDFHLPPVAASFLFNHSYLLD